MEDYSLCKMKDISRSDVSRLVGDLVEELHMDCSKKIDPDIFAHTVKKFTGILCDTQFRELAWKTVQNITKMGITSSYGTFTRIDYQTLASWLYKSQPTKSNWADKSIEESRQLSNLTSGDFRNISLEWSEFTKWLRDNYLFFIENISVENCNLYHSAAKSGSLSELKEMMIKEHDPNFEYKLTYEQAKQQHESEQVFG